MSKEIKVYRIEGEYTKKFQKYVIRKEKRAISEEAAIEKFLSEVTSIGIFRRKVKITSTKELKAEEITDPLIIQLLEQ
jgi:ribosomal protein L20A (L18A)